MNSVRIFGLDEDDEDDLSHKVATKLNNELGLNLTKASIDVTHRIGKKTEGSIRPIITRFVRREDRLEILHKRKQLKGKPLAIQPDLTRPRLLLLKEAQKQYETRNVWCDFSGRIWRKAIGNELRNKVTKVELTPKRFPGVFSEDEVDFSSMRS